MTDRMKKYSGASLAKTFLEYYAAKGHTVVESSPLVPDDPTLLFTAAGMVPFKAYYNDPDSAPYATAASVQKCLRAGGKQSDLENVGRTLRHHTFFEMLGNFSFGDYFKQEAIDTAWDLSVNVWGMDKQRIWVSVYQDDDEAYDLWTQRIGIPEERMVRLGNEDNFWGPVGDTGVCGPSSELYYDTGRDMENTKDSKPGDDNERFIEYWNLVFPQFFYTAEGNFDNLPRPGIDTGLGLERLAFILQEVDDNYHTDLFLPIRDAIKDAIPNSEKSDRFELAVNAAADHVRALTFAITEHKRIVPQAEGRGYVLRRLLRRAHTKLHPFGVRQPVLVAAIPAIVDIMGDRYPQLRDNQEIADRVIRAEEEHFLSTIENGWARLQELLQKSRQSKTRTIAGDDAFVLYDTYGFPFELTQEMADDEGLKVDEAGYVQAMGEQRERSRKHQKTYLADMLDIDENLPFTAIGEPGESTAFLGYDSLDTDAVLDQYRSPADGIIEVTTDKTVFYPVGGGQVGDRGVARVGGQDISVVDTMRNNDKIVHVLQWADKTGDELGEFLDSNRDVQLSVDPEIRYATMRNHTATHLLHRALKNVLGEQVNQAGSLVAPDRLRFDFNYFELPTPEQVAEIERQVNVSILDDMPVTWDYVAYKDAIASGAMALFGEKYGDEVRVVTIGDYSRELCGGTHLRATGEIGPFMISHASSVAAGYRRVEALTGTGAMSFLKGAVDDRHQLAEQLKVTPADVHKKVQALLDENEALRKKLAAQQGKAAATQLSSAVEEARDVNGVKLVTYKTSDGDLGALRRGGDLVRDKLDVGMGLLMLESDQKSVLLIVASDALVSSKNIKAGDIARQIGDEFSLRGGGKPHMAQLGLRGGDEFDKIVTFVEGKLSAA